MTARIVVIDFETYWDNEFSLSKVTMEEYIRSPQFEVIGVSVKEDADYIKWYTGKNIKPALDVSVKEVDGKVIFLRKLVRGGSEHSFGIHVAEIAGMPRSIVKRSQVILKQFEADNASVGSAGKPNTERLADSREGMQMSIFQLDDPVLSQVRDEILGLDINNLTPVEALNKLNEIKKIVTGKSQ